MLATIAVKSQFLGANREINIRHHRTLPMLGSGSKGRPNIADAGGKLTPVRGLVGVSTPNVKNSTVGFRAEGRATDVHP